MKFGSRSWYSDGLEENTGDEYNDCKVIGLNTWALILGKPIWGEKFKTCFGHLKHEVTN
jgi:hypothetical protein